MIHSSNPNMEDVFKQLSAIKQVKPSERLYAKILLNIQTPAVYPLYWSIAVVCLLLFFVLAEWHFIAMQSPHSVEALSTLMSKTNNMLYYE